MTRPKGSKGRPIEEAKAELRVGGSPLAFEAKEVEGSSLVE